MDLRETRVAIAATLAGLVLATGIGAAATPAPPSAPPARTGQQLEAPVTSLPSNGAADVRVGR